MVTDSARIAREQDAISISVDARSSDLRAQTKGVSAALSDGTLAAIAFTYLTPEPDPAADGLLRFLETNDVAMTRAVERTPEGYRAELAIPATALDAQAGSAWKDLRIEVRAYDFDADQTGSQALYWQPTRFGNAPLTGTGSFTRGE